MIPPIIGWDIGGVNTKAARVAGGQVVAVRTRPYELQRAPQSFVPILCELALDLGVDGSTAAHAVTMTAELSQLFRTKREGVAFVLDGVAAAFRSPIVGVFAADGAFLAAEEARMQPLRVAAANWSATARAVARHHPDVLLIDVGTTTTDIVPIVGGVIMAEGQTDPARLACGELVYTGALRTPVEAIASQVPLGMGQAGVSAEGFALAGDVHLWRGTLMPQDYTVPTPDGRPATREFAGERLARVVCADRESMDETAVSAIADALAAAQVTRIAAAIARVRARHPSIRTAMVAGVGIFLAEAAARAASMDVITLAGDLGDAAARCAPAAAVGLLFEQVLTLQEASWSHAIGHAPTLAAGATPDMRRLDPLPPAKRTPSALLTRRPPLVDTVVKVGGGVLSRGEHVEAALAVIAVAARHGRLLVVPGGGPFADAVREVDRRLHLSDSASHWMAILAMDQYAHLLAEHVPRGELVGGRHEIARALGAGLVPILMPSRWLREADALPHSWEVTSDSIAAWIAGEVGARRLVLVKPVAGANVVDPYFDRVLPADVKPVIVSAEELDALQAALSV